LIFGFNTDIKVGDAVYHIQTEDRGPSNPVIDSTIYARGRILHRRANSYKELRESPEFSDALLRERLEQQHRGIIEELRTGALALDHPDAKPKTETAPAGIHVQLLNPATWLSAGTASLEIEVSEKNGSSKVSGAQVEVVLAGAKGPVQFGATTSAEGRATLTFPMPRLGGGGLELVIRATAPGGTDEIRYALKPKIRTSTP
jgi:hypothetical protein